MTELPYDAPMPYVGTVGSMLGTPVLFTEHLPRGVVVLTGPELGFGTSLIDGVSLIVGAPRESLRDRRVRLAVQDARDVVRRGLRAWASDELLVAWAFQDLLDALIDRHVDR